MKKLALIMAGILLVSLVAAQLISFDSNITVSRARKNALSRVGTGIDTFTITALKCDGESCTANIYKKGAINTDITIPQKNCTEYETIEIREKTYPSPECKTWHTYTDAELVRLRDDAVEERLNQIADTQIARENPSQSEELEEGSITVK